MKTPSCVAADDSVVQVSDGTRQRLHGRCPGAYRSPDGEAHACSCECHGGAGVPQDHESASLPTLAPVGPDARGEGLEAERRPKRAPESTNRCACCGRPCKSRFLPGHDAKLKSRLYAAAKQGDAYAWAELALRGWSRLGKISEVERQTREEGESIATNVVGRGRAESWIERRNQLRASLGGT